MKTILKKIATNFWIVLLLVSILWLDYSTYGFARLIREVEFEPSEFQGTVELKDTGINFIIQQNKEEMSRTAAEVIIDNMKEVIKHKGKVKIGLPTGNTPKKMYKIWREEYKDEKFWSKVEVFQLDEYVGLSRKDKRSFAYYLEENLPEGIGKIHYINGNAEDSGRETKRYRELIKDSGGLDIVVLGIGQNAHIAFNEPGTDFGSGTRVDELAQDTREANAGDFNGNWKNVPKEAITIGIKEIMDTEKVFLLASGEGKAKAIDKSISINNPKESIPCSILLDHDNATFIVDKEAAGGQREMSLYDIFKTQQENMLKDILKGFKLRLFISDLDFTLGPISRKYGGEIIPVRTSVINKIKTWTEDLDRKFVVITGARTKRVKRQLIEPLQDGGFEGWENLVVIASGGSVAYGFNEEGKQYELSKYEEIILDKKRRETIKQAVSEFKQKYGEDSSKLVFRFKEDNSGKKIYYDSTLYLRNIPQTKDKWEEYARFFEEKFKNKKVYVEGPASHHSLDFGAVIDGKPANKAYAIRQLKRLFNEEGIEIEYENIAYVGDSFGSKYANDFSIYRLLRNKGLVFNVGLHLDVPKDINSLGIRGDMGTQILFEAILEVAEGKKESYRELQK